MIINQKVGADLDVAEEKMAHTGALDSVHDALVREVVGFGENVGWFIRPQSVRVKLADVDEVRRTRRYRALWHPDPRDVVLFVGGPWDGEERALDYDEAPLIINLLSPPAPDDGWRHELDTPMTVTQHPSYGRAGIDPQRDCWVYEYTGT